MLEKKIDAILDRFGEKVGNATDDISRKIDDLSSQMKIVIGVSLGLSVAETILLFAILKKLGR